MIVDHRYRLLDQLGSGGMGAVYRAYDRLSGETVALKRLPASPIQLTSPELRLALAHEFQALSALRHPNVIGVREYGFDEGHQPYFTMELLPGARPITDAEQYLPVEQKTWLLWQLLSGLVYIHRHRLIHRDLKPANVLVVGDTVKVLDFGLATMAGRQQPPSGTLAYMAPELLRGETASVASDLYAAGIIAYELFVGWHPFSIAPGEWVSPDELREPDFAFVSLSPSLEKFIRTLLAHEPAGRYPDAAAAILALQEATGLDLPLETAVTRESFLQAAPFVGRTQEMQLLNQALWNAMDGKGSAWVVRGESGIGKTRLLQTLRTSALVEDVFVARAQAIQEGSGPYQLWRDVLRPLTLATELDELEAAVLRAIVPDVDVLLERLDHPIPDAPALPSAEAARVRLAGVVADLLRRSASVRPLLLMFEDIHWADRDSLALLRRVRHLAKQLPLMVVLTYRPGERPALEHTLQGLVRLDLRRLLPADVADLSEAMLGRAGRQSHLVDFLQTETEGNTFFMVEVVRALAEEAGRLDQIAGMNLPLHVFAGGMQQMVQRRLGRIPTRYRPFLQLAAVAGRQIDLAVMAQLAAHLAAGVDVEDVEQWLTACANAMVLERPDGSLRWQFSHDKLREGIFTQLNEEQRQASYERVAHAVEEVYAADLAAHYPDLAFYYAEAGKRPQQRHYLKLAAAQAEATYANEAAAGYYEQLYRTAEDLASRADALNQLAGVLHFIGRWDEALQRLQEALTLEIEAQDILLQARSHFLSGRVFRDRRTFPEALRALEAAKASFISAGNQTGVCETLIETGICCYFQGDYGQAESLLLQALELARRLDDRRNTASALHNAGNVYFDTGNYELSQRYYEESLALSRSLGDKAKMASTLNNLGILASYRGDLETTLHRYEEALAIRREIGDRLGIGVSLNNLGIVYKDKGDLEQATHYYEASLRVHEEHNDRHSMSFPLNNLGAVAFEREDFEQARALFQQALALREESRDRWSIASVVSSLGDVSLAVGDYAEARRLYHRSLEAYRDIGDRLKIAYNLIGLAAVIVGAEPADSSQMQTQTAATLLAFVEQLLPAEKLALESPHQRVLERTQAALRTRLDEATLVEAQRSGRHMALKQAITLALECSIF
jgi:tetratricopeptide (TPR) repeat protein